VEVEILRYACEKHGLLVTYLEIVMEKTKELMEEMSGGGVQVECATIEALLKRARQRFVETEEKMGKGENMLADMIVTEMKLRELVEKGKEAEDGGKSSDGS
jgi:hypothetical protein